MRESFWPLEFRIYIFRPMRTTNAILPGSPPPGNINGRANHSRLLFASSLARSWTDHLFPLSPQSSPLSIMRRAHPIHGPLVSGKSFFHHSSFLLNQRILGETNWIFSTHASIQHFNFCFDFVVGDCSEWEWVLVSILRVLLQS